MLERAAGASQKIVVYTSRDVKETKGAGLSGELVVRVADDASQREAEGWGIVAYDTAILSMRGTTILGLGEPHDIAITVVYRRL